MAGKARDGLEGFPSRRRPNVAIGICAVDPKGKQTDITKYILYETE